jgi:peptidylprolyl isomerase
MRRAPALLAVPLLAAAGFIAGCSSTPSNPDTSVSVSGAFGSAPKVSIPSDTASQALYAKTLIAGKGAVLAPSQSFEASYEVYVWSGKTHKLAANTYTTHAPSIFSGPLLPGLTTALKGAKVGSRVLAVIPPKQGMGTSGNAQLGITGTDTLVFVMDVTKAVDTSLSGKQTTNGGGSLPTVKPAAAGKMPTITIPKSSPPSKLTSTVLIKGTGPKVTTGETVLVQYTGVNWTTGKTFDSSYLHGANGTSLPLSTGGVIPGWVKGLTGQTVGSRVLLTIPPADGYGKTGQPQAGIKGTDTLVFSVDILDAVPAATQG